MYNVYGIYNKLNGKLYIGITNNIKRRWSEHKKKSKKITEKSYPIHQALAKYGISNFVFKNIENTSTLDEANIKEMQWIKLLKENNYQLYNQTNGGDGTKGCSNPWTDEQKKKKSIEMSGSNNPMFGIKLFGKSNGNYGKQMKPHVKESLLKTRRKLTDQQIQSIINLFASGKYTQTQLSKDFNVSLTQIHRIVRGKSWIASIN